MLELKLLRQQPDFVVERLAVKNFDAKQIVADILDIDAQRRSIQTQLDANLSRQNQAAKSIGFLMKEGKREEAENAKKEVAELKNASAALQQQLDNALQIRATKNGTDGATDAQMFASGSTAYISAEL